MGNQHCQREKQTKQGLGGDAIKIEIIGGTSEEVAVVQEVELFRVIMNIILFQN